jgi:hypothetical protein
MFFSPRLQVVFLEPQRHLALADRGDDPLLDGMSAEQFQRPAQATFGRFAARQRNHLLPLPRRKRGRSPASRRVVQSPLNSVRTEAFPNVADHPFRTADVLDDFLVGEPFVGLEQHQRSPNHAHRSRARLH